MSSSATPGSGAHASMLFLVLRRMRAPLITLVVIYAVSVVGLVLVPGVGSDGAPAPPMSFFHAFYFVSYTATTIGFGEIPAAFSDAQRAWATAIIYLSVIAWSYSILTLLALLQDRAFTAAMRTLRFERRVRRIGEPFYLVLGAGDTGLRLIRTFDRLDMRFVVVEKRESRIQELELEDFRTDAPVLNADARSPQVLLQAGIAHRRCRAVLAVTNDDAVNLAIAATTRLLNPDAEVLVRAVSRDTVEALAAFQADHVVDPYERFARHLVLAMRAPGCYRLLCWLEAPPDAELGEEHEPPRGPWVVCRYGRFGTAVARELEAHAIEVRLAEPLDGAPGDIRRMLEAAGIAAAQGLVVGTDDDIANLAIATIARTLNPGLFLVVRQSDAANRVLFARLGANLTVNASQIVADESLALLTTPLLDQFIAALHRQTDAWADEVIRRLVERAGTRSPKTWMVRLDRETAPAVVDHLAGRVRDAGASAPRGDTERRVSLAELLRDPRSRDRPLEAIVLLLARNGEEILVPDEATRLAPGDQLLFAGRGDARRHLQLALGNANVLEYLRTGRDRPGGWVFRRLEGTPDG